MTTAAAWLGHPDAPGPRLSFGPRALDARGLATMHHVLVQLAAVELRARFAETCRAFGDVIWCDDLDELATRAASREALAVVIDVVDGQGESTAAAVVRIRARRTDLPIVLWCDRDSAVGRIDSLLAAGVSAVVFRDDTEFESRLLSAMTRGSDVAFQQLTDQALYRRVPMPLIPVVRYCLDHAAGNPRVEMVARAIGARPKTLAAQLRRAGLPPVSTLVMWSKALAAAYRLEKTTESVAVIARALGFTSGSALRRLLKRCANESPSGLREVGGFGWVLRCFERFLARHGRE